MPIQPIEPNGQTIHQVLIQVPIGVVLSAGTSNADGTTWTFMGSPPADLTLTASAAGEFGIVVTIESENLETTASVAQKVIVS